MTTIRVKVVAPAVEIVLNSQTTIKWDQEYWFFNSLILLGWLQGHMIEEWARVTKISWGLPQAEVWSTDQKACTERTVFLKVPMKTHWRANYKSTQPRILPCLTLMRSLVELKTSIRILYRKSNRIDYKSTRKSAVGMNPHLNSMTKFNHSYIMTIYLL